MGKHFKLLCFGIVPMVVGFVYDKLLMFFITYGIYSRLLPFIFLIAWGYAVYKLASSDKNPLLQILEVNAFGMIMISLVLFQHFVLGGYWPNIFGFATQTFFLPIVAIASLISSPFMKVIEVWPMYIVSWLLLIIVSSIGVVIKRRKNK